MDQERPSLSASEVATVFPRWRSGSDIHQSAARCFALSGLGDWAQTKPRAALRSALG
jgi:hypothetical protein